MERWILFAIISMLFAGITSILAKYGMKNVPSDTALVIRTSVVFILIWLNAIVFKQTGNFKALTKKDFLFLALSGLTTTLSWVFYYRAMKIGNVSTVAIIDKGSIVVTLILAFIILGEPLTLKTGLAAILIVSGLLLMIK